MAGGMWHAIQKRWEKTGEHDACRSGEIREDREARCTIQPSDACRKNVTCRSGEVDKDREACGWQVRSDGKRQVSGDKLLN
eukprot:364937-Chlamydomonas_euryale.AAC.13